MSENATTNSISSFAAMEREIEERVGSIENTPQNEREKVIEEVYVKHFEKWFLGDKDEKNKGGAIARLRGMSRSEKNGLATLKQDELDKYYASSIEFQTDYAKWMLSMPRGVRESKQVEVMVGNAVNTVSIIPNEHRAYVEGLIKGAVAAVTFMDLVGSMGDEYGDLSLDDFAIDMLYDRDGATDFGISVGEKIFQIQLKSIGQVYGGFDEKMIQRVSKETQIEGREIRFGNRKFGGDAAKRMMEVRKEWWLSELDIGGNREVIPLVIYVPSTNYSQVGTWTGFLNPNGEGVGDLQVTFGKRMREFGFIISADENESRKTTSV